MKTTFCVVSLVLAGLFVSSPLVVAQEDGKLQLTVSTVTRFNEALPRGHYRVTFTTKMNDTYWRELVKKFAEAERWKIVAWDEKTSQILEPSGVVISVDDIVINGKPSWRKVTLLSKETTGEKFVFTVEGQVNPRSLQILGLGYPLRSVGEKFVYQQ